MNNEINNETLENKLNVLIVGFGVVGSATAKGLKHLNNNVSIYDVKDLSAFKDEYNVKNTLDISDSNVIMMCVPTPTVPAQKGGEIDLNILKDVVRKMAQTYKGDDYKVFVVRSTVPSGVTRRLGEEIESVSGKTMGKDFGMVMNPEFLRAYNSEDDFRNPRSTVIGELDEKSGEIVHRLYKRLTCPFYHVSLEEAEFTKYGNNNFNAFKISFFNNLYLICKNLNIVDRNKGTVHHINYENVRKILLNTAEGLWNPDYGTHAGVPFGGTCLPKDTQEMFAYLNHHKLNSDLFGMTLDINEEMKHQQNDVTGEKYFQKRQDPTYENLPDSLRNAHVVNSTEDVPDTIVKQD
jgi:UDPglucose 6-dehydrogenase